MTIVKPTEIEFDVVQTEARLIIQDLRSRYPECTPPDLNTILNCLCAAVVIHISSSAKPEHYERFAKTVHTLISENLKLLGDAKPSSPEEL